MKVKYIQLKPTEINERTLDYLEDEADATDWRQKSKELQMRRWRKLNRRIKQEAQI